MEQRGETASSAVGRPPGDACAACSWSEEVEDLLAAGERDTAISRLESLVSELSSQQQSSSTALQLSSVLQDLARIYSSAGFSLKADQLHSRALLVKESALHLSSPSGTRHVEVDRKGKVEDAEPTPTVDSPSKNSFPEGSQTSYRGHVGQSTELPDIVKDASLSNGSSDDDWEAIADREPNDLLPVPSECLSELSMLPVEDKETHGPKRRGRGTFSYRNHELYSDQLSDDLAVDEEREELSVDNSEENAVDKHSKYGTRHVLVLTEFPPSTRTTELEKLLEDFKGHGVVIRWVNDTTALAVFRTPAVGRAFDARNSIQFPFKVRILDEDDALLNFIPVRDLEPPRQRPQTSARTAQRLIAQGMGLKLPSSSTGSREFRQQEEARKDRIIRRQKLRDDAWGAD